MNPLDAANEKNKMCLWIFIFYLNTYLIEEGLLLYLKKYDVTSDFANNVVTVEQLA